MRWAVEPWAPEYGSPVDVEGLGEDASAEVDAGVEHDPARWTGLRPGVPAAACTSFVDGVLRVDAQLWITEDDGAVVPGVAASWAAGAVRCDGAARLADLRVRRAVVSAARAVAALETPCARWGVRRAGADAAADPARAVLAAMRSLEAGVAADLPEADLLVLDGPLQRDRDLPPHATGYVKTQHRRYLPGPLQQVVHRLEPGQRTPLFLHGATRWRRFAWYLRLPGAGGAHPLAGIVRGEASGDLVVPEAARLADLCAATLPAFVSTAYKDPRAPQNLVPIGALERRLRDRLGDRHLLYRSLRTAAIAG
jgi:hypothetical protein